LDQIPQVLEQIRAPRLTAAALSRAPVACGDGASRPLPITLMIDFKHFIQQL